MATSSPTCCREGERLSSVARYASQNPIKFVAIVSALVTGAVPVGAFLLYAAGTVVCTLVAAVVLDLTLLAFGVFGLLLALCFVGCISGGVAAVFSLLYLGYRVAAGSLNQARTRLAPTTVAASTTAGVPPSPSSEGGEDPFDKNKLTASQIVTYYDGNARGGGDGEADSGGSSGLGSSCNEDNEEQLVERHSDLWRTSLTVLALAAAIFIMSYTVLVTAVMVVNYT